MSSPQFTVYSHPSGPNNLKVAFVLKALKLTYETIYLDISKGEQKAPAFTKFNPNGRVPAIIDHKNGDFVIWESGAILLYLVENYDTEHKISAIDAKEKVLLNQWLFFQASGQGPMFGQRVWFTIYTPEPIPYAIERYSKEVDRVTSVLDDALAKSSSGYLVGDKLTIADLAFVSWSNIAISMSLGGEGVDLKEKYPHFAKWHEGLFALPYVKAAYEKEAAVAEERKKASA